MNLCCLCLLTELKVIGFKPVFNSYKVWFPTMFFITTYFDGLPYLFVNPDF